jgi:anti-sigma B factor antagonist
MNISVKDVNDIKVVQFDGKLDSNTAKDAEAYFNNLLKETTKILVDFEKLDYTSSAGLRVLLSVAKQLKADGGQLRLCNLNDTVQEIFDMSGFSSILSVFPSESDAIEGF